MPRHQKRKRVAPAPAGTRIPGVVPHPRYGDIVVPTQWATTERTIRRSYWGYKNEKVFSESAIPADVKRQNYTVIPRYYYVDILRQCSSCQRPFIFFAREQQHWYEELGFTINADCVHCVECRKSDQQLRRRFMRYSKAVSCKGIGDREFATLVEDAAFLFEVGVLRDEQKLRRFRNLARRRIPGSSATTSIERVVAGLEQK